MSSLIPRHQRLLITLMIVLLGGLPAGAEKLRPQDETARAPNFAAFKTRFMQAVKVRDVVWLESRITPHSHFGFGPNEQGISGFRSRYRPEDPDSPLWRTLEKIMGTAGSYHPEEGMVCFPWLYRRLPTSDGESRAVILGDDVDVRAGPGAQTPVQERLSWDIVEVLGQEGSWVHIRGPEGSWRSGWVHADFIHSPMGPRIGFVRQDGSWRIQFLVSGD